MIDTKIIQNIPVLEGLSDPELQVLAKIITVKKYNKGEILFEAGEARKSFFIVLSGQAHIYRIFNEEVQTLAILGKHSFAVESALTNPKLKHSHSCEVTESGDMIEILGKDFLKLAEDYSQIVNKIYSNIIENLTERLHHANNKLVTIYSTGKIASSYSDLDNLTDLLITTILKIIKAQKAIFALYYPAEGRVVIQDARGYGNNQRVKNLKIDLFKDPILGQIYRTRREISIVKEQYRKQKNLATGYSSQNMLGVPMQVGNRVVGAILLGDKERGREFSYNNQILLGIIARQIVLPIAMAETTTAADSAGQSSEEKKS
ncbi:MAG: cyclic nucleotide-binding domain-containing protein [Patescibacteria group bacterium]|nr:cyclic nucleotide-binding domain-containing protein [Patescibacteria group bacterium]MDD5566634.1 cyclic nucleotide-binding domain-containing protein [Patescibacteria group bacterium]